MSSENNNCSTVVTVKRSCNAIQVVREQLSQISMDARCELYLKLLEKADRSEQKIVLFELSEPYHYLAYVGTTKMCVIEIEPTEQENDAKEIIGEKEIVEASLAYLAGGNGGLNGMRQQCEECGLKNRYDCYKENIRDIMVEKGLLEKKASKTLTFVV